MSAHVLLNELGKSDKNARLAWSECFVLNISLFVLCPLH